MTFCKIGFIGLGIMGKPMARNLLNAGYSLVVYDVNEKPMRELASIGAGMAENPKDVAEKSDVVILMLPNSPHVEEVVLGKDGVLEGARNGQLIIDMSSIAPLVSVKVAEKCAEKGVRFMDAPVSGGEPGAIDGTLSIMCGAEEADFEEALPILKVMGKEVTLVGKVGSGNTAKLANQIMVAVNIAAMSEALVLGVKAGVDPNVLYQAVRRGLAGSAVLDAKAPKVIQRDFRPGFKINLHIKDLNNVLDTGHSVGAPLPLTSLVMEMMQYLKSVGNGELDHSGLVQYYEELAKIQVKSK